MKTFEYDISLHPAETFRQVTFFCAEDGSCNLEEVPQDQIKQLSDLLNDKGLKGWELVQISFGRDGLMAFWKRGVPNN